MLDVEVHGARETAIHLGNYAEHISDFSSFWPEVAQAFAEREKIWFRREGEGSWPELSDPYAAWKASVYPGKPKLVASGDMRETFTDVSQVILGESNSMVVLGSADPKAAYHQHGTSKMPARPPLIPAIRLKAAIARMLKGWADYRSSSGSERFFFGGPR